MARKPRIHYPGAVYHVILRGNAGQPIFFDDRDRYRLYLIVQSVVEKFGCRVHGFCFMTNHGPRTSRCTDWGYLTVAHHAKPLAPLY